MKLINVIAICHIGIFLGCNNDEFDFQHIRSLFQLFAILLKLLISNLKYPASDFRVSSGFSFATAKPSKPSCPKGLSVKWAPANTGLWMCCKNSDKVKDCKQGQAPFPYGPRSKFICCQCPTGQVLNNDMNGCVSTGVPSPLSTSKPTPSPTHQPTPSPSAAPGTTPSGPTPLPTYQPTPAPTHHPTAAPTEAGTPDPPRICGADRRFDEWSSKDLLYKGSGDKKMTAKFRMCCLRMDKNTGCDSPNHVLYDSSYNKLCCYCIDKQTWKDGTPPECS
jgi:hypothetical protein